MPALGARSLATYSRISACGTGLAPTFSGLLRSGAPPDDDVLLLSSSLPQAASATVASSSATASAASDLMDVMLDLDMGSAPGSRGWTNDGRGGGPRGRRGAGRS